MLLCDKLAASRQNNNLRKMDQHLFEPVKVIYYLYLILKKTMSRMLICRRICMIYVQKKTKKEIKREFSPFETDLSFSVMCRPAI